MARYAESLNCSAYHLSAVIHGRRVSKNLLRAYRELLAAEKTAPQLGAPILQAGHRFSVEPLTVELAAQLTSIARLDGASWIARMPLALVPVTAAGVPEPQPYAESHNFAPEAPK
ncbi:MAG: hypothetical protein ABMA01_22595 [Chthoniobacteraceae bacterium]